MQGGMSGTLRILQRRSASTRSISRAAGFSSRSLMPTRITLPSLRKFSGTSPTQSVLILRTRLHGRAHISSSRRRDSSRHCTSITRSDCCCRFMAASRFISLITLTRRLFRSRSLRRTTWGTWPPCATDRSSNLTVESSTSRQEMGYVFRSMTPIGYRRTLSIPSASASTSACAPSTGVPRSTKPTTICESLDSIRSRLDEVVCETN